MSQEYGAHVEPFLLLTRGDTINVLRQGRYKYGTAVVHAPLSPLSPVDNIVTTQEIDQRVEKVGTDLERLAL